MISWVQFWQQRLCCKQPSIKDRDGEWIEPIPPPPDACVGGAIVVFAKCPVAGASKTRLAPLLGPEGSALLAKAMLSDVLVALSECVSTIILRLRAYAYGGQLQR